MAIVVEVSKEQVEEFIDELIAVYQKHRLCITSYDPYVGLLVEPLDEEGLEILREANFDQEFRRFHL